MIAFLLVCLACVTHGSRVQRRINRLQSDSHEVHRNKLGYHLTATEHEAISSDQQQSVYSLDVLKQWLSDQASNVWEAAATLLLVSDGAAGWQGAGKVGLAVASRHHRADRSGCHSVPAMVQQSGAGIEKGDQKPLGSEPATWYRALQRLPSLMRTAGSQRDAGALPAVAVAKGVQMSASPSAAPSENRQVASLAIPALCGALIDPLLGLIDTAWIGRMGSVTALGAVAAASEIFTLAFAASLALRESSSSTIARLSSAGRANDAARFAWRTIQMGFAAGLILAVIVASPATAPWCVSLMGAPPGSPLFSDALAYARIRGAGLPIALARSAAEGAFRGLGDTRIPLYANIMAALANTILDPIFIFAPLHLGVGGAAAATVVAQGVALAFLLQALFVRFRETCNKDSPPKSAQISEEQVADTGAPPEERSDDKAIFGTTAATLMRTTSVLGCWVYIASAVARLRGPQAIAAHGVVLNVWLLFVLAADAPAVAAQVLCTRKLSQGDRPGGRALFLRLMRLAFVAGGMQSFGMLAVAQPASKFFFSADPSTVALSVRLFQWAALNTIIVGPTVVTEGVLLGAGRSYRYLATVTLVNAIMIGGLTHSALLRTAAPAAAWQCIMLFFVLRLSAAGTRILSAKSGFGNWNENRPVLLPAAASS